MSGWCRECGLEDEMLIHTVVMEQAKCRFAEWTEGVQVARCVGRSSRRGQSPNPPQLVTGLSILGTQ